MSDRSIRAHRRDPHSPAARRERERAGLSEAPPDFWASSDGVVTDRELSHADVVLLGGLVRSCGFVQQGWVIDGYCAGPSLYRCYRPDPRRFIVSIIRWPDGKESEVDAREFTLKRTPKPPPPRRGKPHGWPWRFSIGKLVTVSGAPIEITPLENFRIRVMAPPP